MLDSLHIKNFRCFEDLTIPSLGRVNLIVGKNNSGKSTLLEAIAVFVTAKDITPQDHPSAANVIDKIRDILSQRNEFFLTEDKPSDAQVIAHILYEKNDLKIRLGDINKNESIDISIIKRKEKRLEILFFKKPKDSTTFQYTIIPLDQKNNIIRYWEDETYWHPEDDNIDIDEDTQLPLEINISIEEIKSILRDKLLEKKYQFVPSHLVSETKLFELWDAIYHRNKDHEILEGLRLIIPRLSSLHFSKNPNSDEQAAFLKESDEETPKPLKAMGEGTARLLQIFLHSYIKKGGYLLIDEFENGLHYSIQEEVWEKLFKLAKELDIQVFATTHSQDTIKAFSKIALQSEEEGRLISLGRNEREIDKGKITALTYNEDDIKLIAETGMEVR
ncbi:MAG: hypothetical protein BWK73_10540 [Thiothrix lacustris]|uniref:AAA+ ATPase domain-containing protein n=1 Tax=Thiothrix lacustris TaxID=525917 RepID=A0A1Y1QUD1_9GAMM|nr:MAG: hypothetical protein BWK73_10540 [Thiothrix lacustris]